VEGQIKVNECREVSIGLRLPLIFSIIRPVDASPYRGAQAFALVRILRAGCDLSLPDHLLALHGADCASCRSGSPPLALAQLSRIIKQ
jgi:hypothetical protein